MGLSVEFPDRCLIRSSGIFQSWLRHRFPTGVRFEAFYWFANRDTQLSQQTITSWFSTEVLSRTHRTVSTRQTLFPKFPRTLTDGGLKKFHISQSNYRLMAFPLNALSPLLGSHCGLKVVLFTTASLLAFLLMNSLPPQCSVLTSWCSLKPWQMVLSGLRVTHLQVLGNHFSSQQSVMASHPGLQGKAYTINNYHSNDFNC